MTLDAWIATATVAAVFALMAVGRWPAYLIMLGGVVVLLVSGVLDTDQALNGFSNPGMITVAVLFVVAAGLRQTGTLAFFVRRALGRPRGTRGALLRMAAPVVGGSAVLNNTPVVAMLLPVISDWCRVARVPASKVMMPLSYFAILGGLITLIGTSTNLVVEGLLRESGREGTGMFGITWVGLPSALLGTIFIILFGDRLLPNRGRSVAVAGPPREYGFEATVQPASTLVDMQLSASGLLSVPGLRLQEIIRPVVDEDGEVTFEQIEAPPADLRLRAGDRLGFIGVLDAVLDVLGTPGLRAAPSQVSRLDWDPAERVYAEVVISRTSRLLARTLREARFRTTYGAVVLGLSRQGACPSNRVEEIDLRPGDALLLETGPDFIERFRNSGDFSLASRIEGEGPATNSRAPIAFLILLGMVTAAGTGWLDMLEAAFLAAGAMVLTRCCSENIALRSIEWPLLLAIGSAFGLGKALEVSGAAQAGAAAFLDLAGNSPALTLVAVFLITSVLTELVTNNAAAAIVFPIAMAAADRLGVGYLPYAIAIMAAASSSFATPIGYQTNLMVAGPGGYKFVDFLRLGIPLKLLVAVTTCSLAPLIYGL